MWRTMAQRYVNAAIARDSMTRTPTGGLRITATPGRTGVLVYTQPDGTQFREYRPADEAFAADSLASLEGAAVTVDHPPEGVTLDNWAKTSVGHTSAGRAADSEWIGCALDVNEKDAVAKVLSKELVELSSGYTCDIDMTPGVAPDGTPYDAVQRNIRYNHTALLPVGWARAGRGARLHLDSACATLSQAEPTNADGTPEPGVDDMKELQEALDRAAKAEATLATEKTRADAAEGQAAALKAQLEKARSDASPEAIGAAVRARVALENDARAVKGADFKVDGLTDLDILRAIAGDAAPKDANESFLRGVATVLVADANKASAAKSNLASTLADRGDADTTPSAREAYDAANANTLGANGLRKAK